MDCERDGPAVVVLGARPPWIAGPCEHGEPVAGEVDGGDPGGRRGDPVVGQSAVEVPGEGIAGGGAGAGGLRGDDQPIAFADRPAVRAARAETDPAAMLNAFARIAREFMERSSAIQHVLATAAQVDAEAAGLLAEIRRQRHTGQSRIVTALQARDALDPGLDTSQAADMVYALLSPDVHRILTIERGWDADRYERWIARSLSSLLPTGHRPPPSPNRSARPGSPGSATTKRAR
jgi:hypothetical protein